MIVIVLSIDVAWMVEIVCVRMPSSATIASTTHTIFFLLNFFTDK